jgi:dTDP-4-amino-4,6-dideoxygalactose transaminase
MFRGQVLRGPEVEQFEQEFAEYIGVRHAIGVSSGRAALYLALKALGLKEGDEIIMPAYTFHIVPLVIHACGLKPIFIDVDPHTYNIDVSRIEKYITPKTRGISATHMYGQPCELDPILEIAEKHKLKVLEDCAHALGADYKGQKIGSFGDLGLFTFAMAKNMPCFGGGMMTTNDSELYQRLLEMVKLPESSRQKSLWKEVITTTVSYGLTLPVVFPFFTYPVMRLLSAFGLQAFDSEPGQETVSSSEIQSRFPTRLTNLQAAVGLHQLTRIETINTQVSQNAHLYNKNLQDQPGIKTPVVSSERTHTFLYYRLEVEGRQKLRSRLFPKGVDTRPDDMSDCTTLTPFREYAVDVPVVRELPKKILEIPNNPHMHEDDVLYVARCIQEATG